MAIQISWLSSYQDKALSEPILVDSNGLPCYWSYVWQQFHASNLAASSIAKHLLYIKAFYNHVDSIKGPGALDDIIAHGDIVEIEEVLESYYLAITANKLKAKSTQDLKWKFAIQFIYDLTLRIHKTLPTDSELRIKRLKSLYLPLRIEKKKAPEAIRSLPASVVEALYEVLDPESSINPFRTSSSKWRAFTIFSLLLHQGLRRSELLILPADAIKSQFNTKTLSTQHWLNIIDNNYQKDLRFTRPGIKTISSIRQLPVSSLTAKIVQEYVGNYRGCPSHSFLMNSQYDQPFSAESMTKLFKKIGASLPQSALRDLRNRTGKDSITAHDLRHTSAVVRLNQLLNQGDSVDEAMQKMRTFFGWSKSSEMPRLYARAVFEDRLSSVWNDAFDNRITILRSIPGGNENAKHS